MPRKPNITVDQDIELQMPVANALATYFDTVYTPDSKFGSVGSGFISEDGTCLAYIAFRVPREQSADIDKLLRSVAEHFEATILVDNPNELSNETH